MAGPFSQHGVNALAEIFQHIHGHKGLDGAGEAAAVNPLSTPALEVMLAQSQRQTHVLLLHIAGRNHVL